MMKQKLRHGLCIIFSELERGIFSVPFAASTLGTVAVLFLGSTSLWFPDAKQLKDGLPWQYYLTVLDKGCRSEGFIFCLPLLAAFPAGISVLTELRNGFLKASLPRCGRSPYVFSKVLLSVLTGGGSLGLGYLSAAGIMGLIYRPLAVAPEAESVSLWPQCLQQALTVFLAGALFALFAAVLGLLFRNRYMAFGGAFMVSYLLIIVTSRYLTDIYTVNPREWFLQEHYWEGGYGGCAVFLGELCVFIAMIYAELLFSRIGHGKRGCL